MMLPAINYEYLRNRSTPRERFSPFFGIPLGRFGGNGSHRDLGYN
jgi:hypothetical protein